MNQDKVSATTDLYERYLQHAASVMLYGAAQNHSLHERCWLVSKHLLTTCQAVVTCKSNHNEFFGAATDFTWQRQEPPATSYATRECRGFF